MKFLSYVLVAAISVGIALFVSNTSDSKGETYDFSNIDNNLVVERQDSTDYSTYYDQLTDYQKSIYNTILETVSTAKKSFKLTNVNVTDFKNNCYIAGLAVQYDHPEYFWYSGGYTLRSSHIAFEEKGEIEMEPYYYEFVSSLFKSDKKLGQLMQRVDEVAELARDYSDDDYERMIFVHDYLIENAYYDHDTLEEYYNTSHSPSCEYIFTAYGCLVEGKTVCSGYAKAFQLVLQRLGYDCSYVTGDAGEAHGWNCVYLNGEGYYVDVTWDDMDLDVEIPMYNYAFINSEELSRTHIVDMEFDSPVCNATEYNFFMKNDFYIDTYSFSAAEEILSVQSDAGVAYIKFGSLDELGRAFKDLIEDKNLYQIDGMDEFKKYYYNEDLRTLTVFKEQ